MQCALSWANPAIVQAGEKPPEHFRRRIPGLPSAFVPLMHRQTFLRQSDCLSKRQESPLRRLPSDARWACQAEEKRARLLPCSSEK